MVERSPESGPRKPKRKPRRAAADPETRAVFLDGARIAEEFGRAPGWFLFLSHRSVEVWAMTRPQERRGLFTARSHAERVAELTLLDVPAAAHRPLSVITRMVGAPERADPYDVAGACRALATWAAEQEKFATALLFAEAALLAVPGDARVMYEAGRYARQGAAYAVADRWLSMAADEARWKADWKTYCLAVGALGTMHRKRGKYRVARRFHQRCLRAAQENQLPEIEARAMHELFTVAAESGDVEEAEKWALGALKLYPLGHERLAVLAHDVAFMWLEQGRFERALRVFQGVLPHIVEPSERVLVLSSIARAAAVCGGKAEFEERTREVEGMIASAVAVENGAQALLDLAHGAVALGQWDLAAGTAERAFAVARARGEGKVQLSAEAVMEAARNEQTVSQWQASKHAERERMRDEMLAMILDMLRDPADPD